MIATVPGHKATVGIGFVEPEAQYASSSSEISIPNLPVELKTLTTMISDKINAVLNTSSAIEVLGSIEGPEIVSRERLVDDSLFSRAATGLWTGQQGQEVPKSIS